MKRVLVIAGVLATLGFTACGENSFRVPEQDNTFLVTDEDGAADYRQVFTVCNQRAMNVGPTTQFDNGGHTLYFVECLPKQ